MGFPLEAEIFFQEIGKKILTNKKLLDPEGKWYRYLDDGLYISNNKNANPDKIIKQINSIHPNIIFTEEKEINNTINYLDFTITRKQNN